MHPTHCRGCGATLRGPDPAPRRQQVTELPVVRPRRSTEYQWHTLTCRQCGVATTAPRPPGVPAGAFGPRVPATGTVCTGVNHLSKRTTAGLLADLFGVELTVGSVTACEVALRGCYQCHPVGHGSLLARRHDVPKNVPATS